VSIWSLGASAAFASPPFFAIGGVYEDGRMSAGERQLRRILNRRDAALTFRTMTHSNSAVTQLYGLLGLHLTDRQALNAELPVFLKRGDLVPTMRGCSAQGEQVGAIAEEIARGNYDVLIARPARRDPILSPEVTIHEHQTMGR
jgi:hypothetical protein